MKVKLHNNEDKSVDVEAAQKANNEKKNNRYDEIKELRRLLEEQVDTRA